MLGPVMGGPALVIGAINPGEHETKEDIFGLLHSL
jgi:hypothetical protein